MGTYDNELVLIGEIINIIPPGIPEKEEVRTRVLCNTKGIIRSEFLAGRQLGFQPEIEFIIHTYEYNGEREVEFNGKRYSVYRAFPKSFEEIELKCEMRAGDVIGK